MRKESLIALFVCGCLSWSASPAKAQWSWNPFSNRTKQSAEQTIPIRTGSSGTTRDPFLQNSSQNRARRISQQTQPTRPSASPITNATYRLILEESRNYPSDVREKFVRGFSKLTDSEARKRIERIRLARAQQKSPGANTVAATDYSRNTSWDQISYEQTASRVEQKPAPSSPGVAVTKSNLPDWSDFAQQKPGHAATVPSSRITVRKSAESYPNPFGNEQTISNRAQTADRQNGVARVPRQAVSQAGPRITPAGHSTTRPLPTIRPATADDNQSHYVTHYAPEASPPQQKIGRTQVVSSFEEAQPVSKTNTQQMISAPVEGQNLEMLIARMESLAQQSQPGSTEASLQKHVTAHVELRLLYLISNEKDRALTAIPGLGREEQIFWTRVFWGLTNYLDEASASSKTERTTVALEQLRHAIQALQGEAGLMIRNTEFCSEIENFGNYTRYDRDEFTSGQEILLYCELENFQSEQIENGIFRTLLKSSIQIRKAGNDGQLIDEVPYNPTEDLCRSRRKDFMQGFKYRLPQRMSPGSYVLELVIEDQLSSKSARSSLNFVVK